MSPRDLRRRAGRGCRGGGGLSPRARAGARARDRRENRPAAAAVVVRVVGGGRPDRELRRPGDPVADGSPGARAQPRHHEPPEAPASRVFRDRARPVRARRLRGLRRGAAAADRQHHADLHLRPVLGRVSVREPARRRLSRLQPVARGGPRGPLGRPAGARGGPAAEDVDIPGVARPLARGARSPRLRVARAHLRRKRQPENAGDRVARLRARAAAGMFAFGIDDWEARGDAFSVYMNLYSRISPLRWRRDRLEVHKPLTGLVALNPVRGTIVLLAAMIGSTSFDGLQQGPVWINTLSRNSRASSRGSGWERQRRSSSVRRWGC